MGLFRKESQLFGWLVRKYALVEKTPSEPSIMGKWWEGRRASLRFAVQERRNSLEVWLGEPAEVTEVYLTRKGEGAPLEGMLGERFSLGADVHDKAMLAKCGPLAELSQFVREVMVFECRTGVELAVDPVATVDQLEADLDIAARLLLAFKKESG